jgi:tetratricopeptide (TPR) repeat protein
VAAPTVHGAAPGEWSMPVPGARIGQYEIPLFSQTVEKYNDALEKWKHPAFYFNLAIAEITLGQYLEAHDHLSRAIQYRPEPLRADRFAEAKKQIVAVERHLGRIRVHCPTRHAEVTLDGITLFTGPGDRDIWVTPRAQELSTKNPEYATQAKRVPVTLGAVEATDLSLRRLVEDRSWSVWKPWAVVVGGAVVAGASGGLHALSARNFSSFDARFGQLSCAAKGCTQQQIDTENPDLTPKLKRARLEQRIASFWRVSSHRCPDFRRTS